VTPFRLSFWRPVYGPRFARVPSANPRSGTEPAAIFVTAIDTNPLSVDPQPVILAQRKAFDAGLTVLTRLTSGKVHVCQAGGGKLGGHPQGQVTFNEFAGPHPAGWSGRTSISLSR
jgi:Na+-transporting NADH:ubiquinone oxidoreductase subunit A